jgi:hypothetical protein
MASASGYNHHRFARALLKKSRKWEASLCVELLPTHWRFAESVSPVIPENIPTVQSRPLRLDAKPIYPRCAALRFPWT